MSMGGHATALGMAEETYRQLETTSHRGRLSSGRYDSAQDRWILWREWAPPIFGVTADRLLPAEQYTQEHWQAEREKRWATGRVRPATHNRATRADHQGFKDGF
ncbi:hypothetical protein [Streptomyces sp. H39-C1]|uniref:hypothetical protein n=1 Tax=Streptomyces sp. H39-C1 TaxID=3004355 RepID=UPI0022AEE898|nr:hypothetical protein [Streptomyces sp. H39-C1]MCZ4103526.1 hypothetical protein [Streptomyces sp. H39-C1]